MALDVGDRNIGVAISDSLLMTAQGRPTLKRSSWQADVEYLRDLVQSNEVTQIVLGNPLHMDGRESRQGGKVAQFGQKLSRTLGVPVVYWDERLTSFAAEQHLQEMGLKWQDRRKHVDRVAAMFILQSYLDSRQP